MKLALVSNDISLQKRLEETGYFEEVKIIVGGINEVKETDILLVSDKVVKFNEFIYWMDSKSHGIKRIYFMLSNIYESEIEKMYAVLKAKKVSAITPKQTVTQIAERLLQEFDPGFNRQKNIITFFGADSKVGVTQISQAVAEAIAKKTELKVCLMFLNGKPSTDYLGAKETSTLDNIKVKIHNSILTASELKDSCICRNNLYILPGNETIMDTRHYTPEHIEYLIQLASQEFSMVIIDAGCYWDMYGMTAGALNSTNFRFLVTTQQKTAWRQFSRTNNQILRLMQIESKDFMMIVNKYIYSNGLPKASNMADLYDMILAAHIPYMEIEGIQAEEEEKSLLSYNDKDYSQAIYSLCKLICTRQDIEFNEGKEEKRSLFGFLGGKKE